MVVCFSEVEYIMYMYMYIHCQNFAVIITIYMYILYMYLFHSILNFSVIYIIIRVDEQIFFSDFPDFIKTCPQPEPVSGFQNGMVTLQCSPTGHPNPSLTWSFENRTIESGGRFSLMNSDHRLSISELELNDSGVYTCTAENAKGVATYDLSLEVLGTVHIRYKV